MDVSQGQALCGTPLKVKTRAELLASINPAYWKFLREDNGDIPSDQEYEATPVAASL